MAAGAARSLTTVLPEKIATAVYAFVTGPLVDDPCRVGKPLSEPVAPAWSARRGDYRVLYLIDETRRGVTVTAVRHRGDAYRS
jgi:mRNA interferase RelE/StbE